MVARGFYEGKPNDYGVAEMGENIQKVTAAIGGIFQQRDEQKQPLKVTVSCWNKSLLHESTKLRWLTNKPRSVLRPLRLLVPFKSNQHVQVSSTHKQKLLS